MFACRSSIGSLLLGGLLAIAMPVGGRYAPAAAAPLKILPDNVCGPAEGNEIRVCGGRLKPEDVVQLHSLITCIVSWQRTSSRLALITYLQTSDPSRFRSVFASDHECGAVGIVRASPILLGGAFAEALLADQPSTERRLSEAAPSAPTDPSPVPRDDAMACLMATGHKEAADFIRTRLYSRRERDTLGPVEQRLGQCLPAGEEMRMNSAVFRSAIAELLFAGTVKPGDWASPGTTLGAETAAPLPPLTPTALNVGRIQVPSVSISPPETIPGSGSGIAAATVHDRADLPTKLDEEEELAKEAQPEVNPESGESVLFKTQAPVRRDQGNPY